MTLGEFLTARLAEETEREIAEGRRDFLSGVPASRREEASAAHDRLLATQGARLNGALKGLKWALTATYWPPAARRRAAVYADHPDYRANWRP
jgi:hypothetical protein